MLKYQIKLQSDLKRQYIELEDFTLSSSSNTMSFLCSDKYHLAKDSLLYTDYSSNGFQILEVSSVLILGKLTVHSIYEVLSDKNMPELKYVQYKNGDYLYNSEDSPNAIFHPDEACTITGNTVAIPTTYYITGDTVETVDGKVYDIFINKKVEDNNVTKDCFTVCGTEDPITPGENFEIYEVAQPMYRVTVENTKDILLKVDYVKPCKPYQYIVYKNKQYYIEPLYSEAEDGVSSLLYENFVKVDDNISGTTVNEDANVVTLNDNDKTNCEIYTLYHEDDKGDSIFLYLTEKMFPFDSGIILAKSKGVSEHYMMIEFDGEGQKCIYRNGKKYVASEDKQIFAIIGDTEYEFTYTDKDEEIGIIDYNGQTIEMKLEGGKAKRVYPIEVWRSPENGTLTPTSISAEYPIISYEYIDIEGIKYRIQSGSMTSYDGEVTEQTDTEYIVMNAGSSYLFAISSREGINKIMCTPIVGIDENSHFAPDVEFIPDEETLRLYNSICYDVSVNFSDFDFYLMGDRINVRKGIEMSNFYEGDLEAVDLTNPNFYHFINYIELPFNARQVAGTNINQENILDSKFFIEEKKNSVNPIVDMDKDIYYPFYSGIDKKNKLVESFIDKITFTLHFRTRDLTTWKINEDYSAINEGENTDATIDSFTNDTNWFCFDYYNKELLVNEDRVEDEITEDMEKELKEEVCNHSDLLWFLNFTDMDVFYQKSNIKRSFLRLLFYDSTDASTQSLLYQAVVWLDGKKLYKTYIDNIKEKKYYNISGKINGASKITVSSEPLDKNDLFTFDESMRLDADFEINNRYLTSNSSEGAYLYLYSNMAEGVPHITKNEENNGKNSEKQCEKTIYMRVMFNHAGEGQSSLFMLPKDINGRTLTNGKDILENKDNIAKGVPLNKLTDSIYIPISLRYDKDLGKFLYYPKNQSDVTYKEYEEGNELNFNLFEVKLQ